MGQGNSFCHTFDGVFNQIANFGEEGAHCTAHDSFARQHVISSQRTCIHKADGNNSAFQRVNLSGNDCLHGQIHFGESGNRIHPLMRATAVCAGTDKLNSERIRGCLQVSDFETDFAFL